MSVADAMSLLDLVRRSPAVPWQDGGKIPWHDAAFSERMLKEHLSQSHDRASRRFETIDKHVEWIDRHLFEGRPSKVLDLGCGPGFYTSRLARRGYRCSGIDFSPASIAYAEEEARREELECEYLLADIRDAPYGDGYALAMLINGEFNTFRPDDASRIVQQANQALKPGGVLLLEPHPFEAVRRMGAAGPVWYSVERGLFSDRPHLFLQEQAWDDTTNTATTRYFIVDAESGEVGQYAGTAQAYGDEEYRSLLEASGFGEIDFLPSLTGVAEEAQGDLMVVVARKPRADF